MGHFHHWVPVGIIAVLFLGFVSQPLAQEQPDTPGACTPLEQEILKLRKTVSELEEANGLFLENLANCTEENQSLLERLNAASSPGEKGAGEEKDGLIDVLQRRLVTDESMVYLNKLSPDELKALILIVEKRLSRCSDTP